MKVIRYCCQDTSCCSSVETPTAFDVEISGVFTVCMKNNDFVDLLTPAAHRELALFDLVYLIRGNYF